MPLRSLPFQRAFVWVFVASSCLAAGCASEADPPVAAAGGAGRGGAAGSSGSGGASAGMGDGSGGSAGAGAGTGGASGSAGGAGGAGGGSASDAGATNDDASGPAPRDGSTDAALRDDAPREAMTSPADAGMRLSITTPAFMSQPGCGPGAMASACATFPRDNTNYGMNISPAMTWSGAPAGTRSFAVVLQDLTNGSAHWVLWNIPATVTTLAENVPKDSAMPAMPAGAQQCGLGAGDGYFGPGACGNVYEFVVYALAIPSFTPTAPTNQTMVRMQLQALGANIIGTGSMRARSFAPNCP
jgi:Raf kinase inhibitor-like YbhB/YbcL family protein